MTAIEIVFVVIGILLVLAMIAIGIVFAFQDFKYLERQRLPRLKNNNLKSDINKEIKRLEKVYRKTDIQKTKLEDKVKVKEQELDDLFFEIRGLTDLKFKVEDNAKGDHLKHSVEEEMAWCKRDKQKHLTRINAEENKNSDEEEL